MFIKSARAWKYAAIAAGSIFTSCDKIKNLIKVEVPLSMEIDFIIPVITDTGYATFGSYDIAVDVDKLIKDANDKVNAENIQSARFQSCEVTVNSKSKDPMDNFTTFSSINTEFHSSTQPQWVSITTLKEAPSAPYYLNLPVNTDLELKDYINGTLFTYKVSGTALRTTTQEIKCKAQIKFIVKAVLD